MLRVELRYNGQNILGWHTNGKSVTRIKFEFESLCSLCAVSVQSLFKYLCFSFYCLLVFCLLAFCLFFCLSVGLSHFPELHFLYSHCIVKHLIKEITSKITAVYNFLLLTLEEKFKFPYPPESSIEERLIGIGFI